MKFCSKCGAEILDEAVVCTNCGCAVSPNVSVDDAPNMGYAVLGFFIPLVGLILYIMCKDKTPLKAKSAGKGALIGFCVGIAFSILYGVVIGSLLGSLLYW